MRVSSPETTDPVDPPGFVPVEKRAGVARVDKSWIFTKTGVWQRQEPTPEKREEKCEPKQERQTRHVRYSTKLLLSGEPFEGPEACKTRWVHYG